MTGLTLAQYRIDSELGRGGMGIVYKATDTKLNRTVALKVLPASALASEEDRARFFREAQAAAQLSHPNIAGVHQIDEAIPVDADGNPVQASDGPRPFIAMEFVEGETLSEHIKKGPVPLKEAVSIAGQVAEALKAAHAKNIVHRDIKSANVMLTPEGIAKVLDFGLAKTNQSTMLTRMGSTLGTVAYMSPEQARGQEVDGRTDLYALGTMLYEMVAGSLPFAGDYEQAVMYSILNEPPEPLTALRTGVPMELERIVGKLLSKEAEYRYQTAADLIADLKSLNLAGSGVSQRSMAAMSAAGRSLEEQRSGAVPMWVWSAMAGIAALAAVLGWVMKPTPPVESAPRHLQRELDNVTSNRWAVLSESARYLATGGKDSSATLPLLYVLDLERNVWAEINNSAFPGWPRFSHDETRIAFVSGGELKVASVTGGEPSIVAPASAEPMVWGYDGSIYFVDSGDRMMVAEPDGSVYPYEFADTTRSRGFFPTDLMPDGRTLLGSRNGTDGATMGSVMDLKSGEETIILDREAWYVGFVEPEFLVVSSGQSGTASLVPFDPSNRTVTGLRTPIRTGTAPYTWHITQSGHLVTFSESGGGQLEMVEVTEDQGLSPILEERHNFEEFQMSSTGDLIAAEINDFQSGADQVVLFDLASGTRRQLTFESGHFEPSFSPDDSEIALVGTLNGAQNIGILRIDGVGGIRWLTRTPTVTGDPDWSPTGDFIVFDDSNGESEQDIFLYSLTDSTSEVFIARGRDQAFPRVSPDGRYVAYESTETRDQEVFVADVETRTPRLVSSGGGMRPAWGPGGRSLYYRRGSNLVMVDFDRADGGWSVGRERIVAEVGPDFYFDVAPTGRIAIARRSDQSSPLLNVVLNWINTR